MFEHGLLPFINESGTPPPPTDNDRVCDYYVIEAFPQETISYNITACNTLLPIFSRLFVQVIV